MVGSGFPVQMVGIVGERVDGDAAIGRAAEAAGVGQSGAAGGATGAAFREALGIVDVVCREAPEGQIGACQRGHLGDVGDFEAEAVVAAGSHRDRDVDRDVEGRNDEGEEGRLFPDGQQRRRSAPSEQVVRIAFVAGVDR